MKRVPVFTRLDIRTLSISAGVAILSACAGLHPALADDVNPQASFPKWSEFPLAPKNVPTPASFAQRVDVQSAQARALKAETDAIVWDAGTAEDLAVQAKSRMNPAMMKPVDKAMTPAEMEALAAGLRKKATPPPIVH